MFSCEKLRNSLSLGIRKLVFFLCIGGFFPLYSLVNPIPFTVLPNLNQGYSLMNSVDFHPKKNLFCVTYTQNNKVSLYEIDQYHHVHFVQSLSNPLGQLSDPQHALFFPDGNKIVVSNWISQTLVVYELGNNNLFSETPIAIIYPPEILKECRHHGMAFSPCGSYLAVAYGASSRFERAIALFEWTGEQFSYISSLKNNSLPGIPKGIAFSPDGTCLLVTFSDINSLSIFNIENKGIIPVPKQTILGENTGIVRPEDVKISPDGAYCVLTNSSQHTVTFYPFDSKTNSIPSDSFCSILQNPEAQFCFPHGVAFSPDGAYLVVSQLGPILELEGGGVDWDRSMSPSKATVNLYLMSESGLLFE